MFKNMQFKIILIIFIIGIVIISALSITTISQINLIEGSIEISTTEESLQLIENIRTNMYWVIGILITVFTVLMIITAIFLSKFVIYPIDKLIKSAEKVTGEEEKIKNKAQNKGNKTAEVNDLENVIDVMTEELKDKLSEVSTQKIR